MGQDTTEAELYEPAPQRKWQPSDWTRWGRRPSGNDPLVLPFSWVTEEVSAAMDQIDTGDVAKRRRTILKMADAVASGNRDVNEVLADVDTVGHSAWYQRMRSDDEIMGIYNLCLQTARHWYDQLEGQRMLKRAAVIEQARDNLIDLTDMATQVLADMLGNPGTSDSVRRQLIADVLDRADEETAAKTTHLVKTQNSPTMRELAEERRRRQPDRAIALGGQPTVAVGPGARLIMGGEASQGEVIDLEDLEELPLDVEIIEHAGEEDGTMGD